MCAPVGFVYLDKFLELLTHSIREVWDDTCARGKGDYMQTSPHFLGLRDPRPRCPGWLPWVAALSASPPRLTSPLRAPPSPPGRTLPPASQSKNSNPRPFPRPERGQGSRPRTDRQTNRRTAPDGRARRALRGPGGECPHPAALLRLAREVSWTDLSRAAIQGRGGPPGG